MQSEADMDEVLGLIIQSPWIEKILAGQKTWEIRTRHASRRERIALIKSKSGCIFGTCRVVDCIGPLTSEEMLANEDKHRVPEEMLSRYCRPDQTYAWVLADPQRLVTPIRYRHPPGAVIWVRLTRSNVADRFDELVTATR